MSSWGEVVEMGSASTTNLGRAIGSSCPSTSIAESAASAGSATIPFANAPTATRRWRLAQFGYTTAGLFGYSHLTGGYVQAVRPNTSACRWPMWRL